MQLSRQVSSAPEARSEFLINVNRPFVFVKFDHIGPSVPRSEDEPNLRIWLPLTNNCRVPILVRANGAPDESPKDEVGVQYEVVRNRENSWCLLHLKRTEVTNRNSPR